MVQLVALIAVQVGTPFTETVYPVTAEPPSKSGCAQVINKSEPTKVVVIWFGAPGAVPCNVAPCVAAEFEAPPEVVDFVTTLMS